MMVRSIETMVGNKFELNYGYNTFEGYECKLPDGGYLAVKWKDALPVDDYPHWGYKTSKEFNGGITQGTYKQLFECINDCEWAYYNENNKDRELSMASFYYNMRKVVV